MTRTPSGRTAAPSTTGPAESAARGQSTPVVGIVVIGRNEGERLVRCLASVAGGARQVVYVDSGSSDDSVATARRAGAAVVELDAEMPFTAARARNAGLARLRQLVEDLDYVQFVDGDCELAAGWVERARDELSRRTDVVAVRGRLRERFPEASIYNRLSEIEWNAPLGSVPACGGIFMVRLAAFDEAGGFDERLIAGEEPELCVRLRRTGGEIWSVDADMAWHDAAMMSFGAWWKRMVRGGHAYAQGAAMHGLSRERHSLRECGSILFWALGLPLVALIPIFWIGAWSLLVLLLYPVQVARIARWRRREGDPGGIALTYAASCVLAKWPQLLGMVTFILNRLRRRQSRLIEHKAPADLRPDAGADRPT